MEEHFDVVIIGSGFGGSVSALRLAEAGQSVCLLERGKAYPPGSFPRSPQGVSANFWNPSDGCHGLFDVWSFQRMEAVISSGLGGGSLIYANVLIRKDEKWFVREDSQQDVYEYWPVTRADLDPFYDRAEQVLRPQKYPFDQPPYSGTSKTLALKEAAERLGLEWFLPHLAVTFANDGHPPVPGELIRESYPNLHGRQRSTCRLCGECDVGCNYGSKNTLDYNYLSLAKLAGADLRPRCEVKAFAPRPEGGYSVEYVRHEPENEGRATDTRALPRHTVTADRLVLAAGTLGSTYLLLKNAAAFPGLSPALGTRFCGNGDLIAFAMHALQTQDGVTGPRYINASHGPVITSTIRVPDTVDGGEGRGFYLQDAGYPEFINWLLETSQAGAVAQRMGRFLEEQALSLIGRAHDTEVGAEVSRLLGPCTVSSTSMPLLGMGRDRPDGKMFLRTSAKSPEPLLDLDWHDVKSRPYYQKIIETARRVAEALGARYDENPMTHIHRFITAHPLGGCPMGRSAGEGVVDSYGQVFGYPGFVIAAGSVLPGPVGANPSFTIAALAERFAERLAMEQHL